MTTPGVMKVCFLLLFVPPFGRFLIHKRVAFVAGAGFQIAATHLNTNNHAFIGTLRMRP